MLRILGIAAIGLTHFLSTLAIMNLVLGWAESGRSDPMARSVSSCVWVLTLPFTHLATLADRWLPVSDEVYAASFAANSVLWGVLVSVGVTRLVGRSRRSEAKDTDSRNGRST